MRRLRTGVRRLRAVFFFFFSSLMVVEAAAFDAAVPSTFPLQRDSSLPLLHKRILLCQPRTSASALASTLVSLGARPVWCPTVSVSPLDEHTPIDDSLLRLAEFHTLALCTRAAVDAFMQRGLELSDSDPSLFRQMVKASGVEIAAFGDGATRLAEISWTPAIVPIEHSARGLADALESVGAAKGKRILIPIPKVDGDLADGDLVGDLRPSGQFDALVERLREYDAEPLCVDAYRLMPTPLEHVSTELRSLSEGTIDAVCLGSEGEVVALERLLRQMERAAAQLNGAQGAPLLVAMGSDTIAACKSSEMLQPGMELRSSEPAQLASALDQHFGAGKLLW